MKRAIAFSAFYCFISCFVFSQRSLVLTNPEGKDTWILNNGDKIKYELKANPDGLYIGYIEEIKDSSMIISGEEIRFTRFAMIKTSKGHAAKSITLGLFLAGIGLAARPVDDMVDGAIPENAIIVGQIAFIGSGLYFFIKGLVELGAQHECRFSSGWKLRSVPTAKLKE